MMVSPITICILMPRKAGRLEGSPLPIGTSSSKSPGGSSGGSGSVSEPLSGGEPGGIMDGHAYFDFHEKVCVLFHLQRNSGHLTSF